MEQVVEGYKFGGSKDAHVAKRVGTDVAAIQEEAKKRARRATFRKKLIGVLDVIAVIAVVLIAWELATEVFNVLPAKMFPPPAEVFQQIYDDRVKILTGIGSSLGIIAQGFIMGTVAALVLGLVLGLGARSSSCAEKVAAFLSAIPPIVYIPYGIALLPTFRSCSVMVIFLATFWPVFTGVLAGVQNVDTRAINSARVLNVKKPTLLLKVILPGALPQIFQGLNIALCLSFILLTSAEMIGGSVGMGYYVKYYSDFGDYTRILAGIIVIGVVITIVSCLFAAIQKRLTRWK
jgi:NitT/TauT family transport system permease protein